MQCIAHSFSRGGRRVKRWKEIYWPSFRCGFKGRHTLIAKAYMVVNRYTLHGILKVANCTKQKYFLWFVFISSSLSNSNSTQFTYPASVHQSSGSLQTWLRPSFRYGLEKRYTFLQATTISWLQSNRAVPEMLCHMSNQRMTDWKHNLGEVSDT